MSEPKLRSSLGEQPVAISSVLTEVAPRYINDLTGEQHHPADHRRGRTLLGKRTRLPSRGCRLAEHRPRRSRQPGWSTTYEAFEAWVVSPEHYDIMTDPTVNPVRGDQDNQPPRGESRARVGPTEAR